MTKTKQTGYTLIELLVVTAVLGILLLGVSTLFMQSLISTVRTNTRQELRAEGQYALDTIATLVRNATHLEPCPIQAESKLNLISADGLETILSLTSSLNHAQIASYSAVAPDAHLTSDSFHVTDLQFSCDTNPQQQPYVTINFTLNRETEFGGDLEQHFRQTVLTRNRLIP